MSKDCALAISIQQMLEQIYDAPARCDVADYLITDPALAAALQTDPQAREVSEALLVSQDKSYLNLSLFLDAEVLRRLGRLDPLQNLHDRNLSDFWLVVEGISHFLYVAYNGHHDKSVTLLELELQAEVDKFIIALQVLSEQGEDCLSEQLHDQLFAYVHFDDGLSAEHLVRYQHASHYAGKYCKTLYQKFLRRVQKPGLLTELRRFYRLTQHAKIRHIDKAFCAIG